LKKNILIIMALFTLLACTKAPLLLKPGSFIAAKSSRPTCGEVTEILLINTGQAMMAEKNMFEGGGNAKREIPILCALLKKGERYILIDTGLNHHFAFDPGDYLGETTQFFGEMFRDLPAMQPGQDVVAQLARMGVSPETVTKIILTHGHVDHTGELSSFPNADIYLWQKEREYMSRALGKLRGVMQNDLPDKHIKELSFENSKPHLTFPGSYDLFNDESVVIVPTPGHTPGSISVSVNTKKGRFLFIGDAAYTLENIRKPVLTGYNENRDQTWETIVRLHDLSKQRPDIRIIPFHDPDLKPTDSMTPTRLITD